MNFAKIEFATKEAKLNGDAHQPEGQQVKLTTIKDSNTDVSSVSPLGE